METKTTEVKKELKSLTALFAERETLRQIDSCYKHFLASYEASKMPVANAQIQLNRITISKEINKLTLMIDEEKANVVQEVKGTVREKHVSTPEQTEAVMLFNKDPRFSITE